MNALVTIFVMLTGASFCWANPQPQNAIQQRILSDGELAPLPEAKPLLVAFAELLDSAALKQAIQNSHTLQLMRTHLGTSLFHLNFVFDIQNTDYPYESPYEQPFPFRPTLEAMDEAIQFLNIVEATTGFKTELKGQLESSDFFKDLRVLYPLIADQGLPMAVPKAVIVARVVEAYDRLQMRLENFGELASFPEFEADVQTVLGKLRSSEIEAIKSKDKAFALACDDAIKELEAMKNLNGGGPSRIFGEFESAFPYRRTIMAVANGVAILDMVERLKYPEVTNWHEVEFSWFQGEKADRKLLGLYHFNRYKYQLSGLLADKEIVLWPFSDYLSEGDLMRLSAAPWGLLGVITKTERGDRHFNSPKDFLYHDVNHVRRIWGYLKRKLKARNADTREKRLEVYREQEKFINFILANTEGNTDSEAENELRKQMRVLCYETFHETARPPDRDSLLYDLRRTPATRQPFELQLQSEIPNIEAIRTFDGNLSSGADNLLLNLRTPTTVRYFWDRAPGYLANVDNKLRWGFYDSVFKVSDDLAHRQYRTPRTLAKAATRLYRLLDVEPPVSLDEMVRQINDRSGQPELWSYYSIKDSGVITISDINALHLVTSDEIQANWRRESAHQFRWKPTDAKLADGTRVNNAETLAAYLRQRGIPEFLHAYFKIEMNPATNSLVMYEDIVNLPNNLLAPNHMNENKMSGAKAVGVVDRIWQKKLRFKNLDDAERWLTTACQAVHQGVLDRNANGARNNPVYMQHWLLLPAANKINDLDLIRLAFDARLKNDPGSLPSDQVTLIGESILRLRKKIRSGEKLRSCSAILTQQKNSNDVK